MQCAATLQGKRPIQKGTDVFKEQGNFWSHWKLYNNKIDLLSNDKFGFRTDSGRLILVHPFSPPALPKLEND